MRHRHDAIGEERRSGATDRCWSYQSYVASLDSCAGLPPAIIFSRTADPVTRLVRACGAALGPVQHYAGMDHGVIQAVSEHIEPVSPMIVLAGARVLLTTKGSAMVCPLCSAFSEAPLAGWTCGACPVLADKPPCHAELLEHAVLLAVQVLLDMAYPHPPADGSLGRRAYEIDLARPYAEPCETIAFKSVIHVGSKTCAF